MDTTKKAEYKKILVSGGTDGFLIDTISLYYDGLVDSGGNKTEIYLYASNMYTKVNSDGVMVLECTLEDKKAVEFINLPMRITMPNVTTNPVNEASLSIDNVSGLALKTIQDAINAGKGVKITHRIYSSNDLKTPLQDPPVEYWIERPSITNYTMTATIASRKSVNNDFPKLTYDTGNFPGLYE